MKQLHLALFGSLVVSAAHAAPTFPTWEGIGYTTSATQVCVDNGDDQVNWSYRVIFKPKMAANPDNGDDSIVLFAGRSVILLQAGASNGRLSGKKTPYNGRYIYGRGGTADYKGTSSISMKPATITPTTGIINLKLEINNNWNDEGCTATIEVNLSPRPD